MFECRSCVLRAIRAFSGDGAHRIRSGHLPLILTPQLSSFPPPRKLSTATTSRSASKDEDIVPFEGPVAEQVKQENTEAEKAARRNLKLEIHYLSDPVKLAERVRQLVLSAPGLDKAVELVRVASRSMNCVVAWNRIINRLMETSQPTQALSLYNEMKKRAQFPDSYTYVALLKGLRAKEGASSHGIEKSLQTALKVYNSLYAPNSRIQPAIIHTNAVLQVCSLALDMDALWSVVSKIPDTGAGSADKQTYTTILHAIREGASRPKADGVTSNDSTIAKAKAVEDGRRMWVDIVRRWKSGEVEMDEELVTAMAKLLLLSVRMRDWDDVLDLFKQTMNLERLVAPLGHADRQTGHVPQATGEGAKGRESGGSFGGFDEDEAVDPSSGPSTVEAFRPREMDETSSSGPRQNKRLETFAFAKPGNATLNNILAACFQMRAPKTATEYWKHLTSEPYNVAPDVANFNSILRVYAVNRTSRKAAELVTELSSRGLTPTQNTIRFAMNACYRDKKNTSSLDHAGKVIDAMEKHLEDPDPTPLIQYLSLALSTDDGDRIVRAIDRLDPIVHNLRSMLSYGSTHDSAGGRRADPRVKDEAAAFLQALIGAIDTLMHRGLVPRHSFATWHARRSDLNTFVGRLKNNNNAQKTPEWLLEAAARRATSPVTADEYGVALGRSVGRADPVAERRDRARGPSASKVGSDGAVRNTRPSHRGKPAGISSKSSGTGRGRGDAVIAEQTRVLREFKQRGQPQRLRISKHLANVESGFADLPGDLGLHGSGRR